jgi:predicted nucleic acid-binding protein
MSYADCFAAALAKWSKAELVTGDPDFKQVEGEIRIVIEECDGRCPP